MCISKKPSLTPWGGGTFLGVLVCVFWPTINKIDPSDLMMSKKGVKKICKQEKWESTRSKLAIDGYKNHTIFSNLAFWLILRQMFAYISSLYLRN